MHTAKKSKNSKKGKSIFSPNDYRGRGMYLSFSIKGFRLFDSLELQKLSRINLFFGPNNCGKTSILEAVYTHSSGLKFGPFLSQVLIKRHDGTLTGALDAGDKLISMFHDSDNPPYQFSLSATVSNDIKQHILTAKFTPSSALADLDPRSFGQYSGTFPINFLSESNVETTQVQLNGSAIKLQNVRDRTLLGKWQTTLDGQYNETDFLFPPIIPPADLPPFKLASMHDILSHRIPGSDIRIFGSLKRYGILDEFVGEMKQVFPEVDGIDVIPYPDGSQGPVYIEITGGRKIPLYDFGDGMRRWFHLLGQVIIYKNAVHCIEEIDATFHPGAHPNLSRLLLQYAIRFNNQLFLTSHSIEFADFFLNALYGEQGLINYQEEDPVRIFTIKRSESGTVEIWSLSGREAFEKRQRYELELRG